MPAETVAAIYDRVAFFRAELKKLDDRCEELLIEWVKANGRLNVGNGISYYLGHSKSTKCIDVPGAIEAILNAVGGEFPRLCDHLSANAIKYGAAKKTIPAEYAKLFRETVSDTLEVKKADEKFLK